MAEEDVKTIHPSKADTFTGVVHHYTYPGIDPLTKSDCTGKAVLVTGASRGMGRNIAVGYTQAGASLIALAARSSTAETAAIVLEAARAAGRPPPRILSLEMNVCDKASVEYAARTLGKEWGKLDILVNNAGYMARFAPLLEVDEEDYIRTWDVNYWGTFKVTKAFLPVLLRGGDKTILNITSMAAQFAGMGGGAYHVSKFALARFTEFVQDEYGSQGVLAYSVHPGGVPTDLSARLPDELRYRMADSPELAAHSIPFLTSKRLEFLGGRWVSCKWDLPRLLEMEAEIVEKDLLKFKCTGLC